MLDFSMVSNGSSSVPKNCIYVDNKEEYDYVMSELRKNGYDWRAGNDRISFVPKFFIHKPYKCYLFMNTGGRLTYALSLLASFEGKIFNIRDLEHLEEFKDYWEYYYYIKQNDKNLLIRERGILMKNKEKKDVKHRLCIIQSLLSKVGEENG